MDTARRRERAEIQTDVTDSVGVAEAVAVAFGTDSVGVAEAVGVVGEMTRVCARTSL